MPVFNKTRLSSDFKNLHAKKVRSELLQESHQACLLDMLICILAIHSLMPAATTLAITITTILKKLGHCVKCS